MGQCLRDSGGLRLASPHGRVDHCNLDLGADSLLIDPLLNHEPTTALVLVKWSLADKSHPGRLDTSRPTSLQRASRTGRLCPTLSATANADICSSSIAGNRTVRGLERPSRFLTS
jgi:hypothetical protein